MTTELACLGDGGLLSHEAIESIPVSRLRVLLADFTRLLGQQMYFWGRDVIHPSGNLLCENGFERRKSNGLQGTSCYRKPLAKGGFIELHGACAGFYEPSRDRRGFLYIRNKGRCFLYSGEQPPAPGFYATDTIHNGPAAPLYLASLRFLDWWLDYEGWVATELPADWRRRNYDAFGSLPASRPALPPREAVGWLRDYRDDPRGSDRLRDRMRSIKKRRP